MQPDEPITADWVAVDWGGSRLRVWAMGADGAVRASAADALGMNRLTEADYEPALLGLISPWLPAYRRTPVLVCGMAGAQQGWRPAPYADLPAELARPGAPVQAPTQDPRLDARILPGLRQLDPPDVMRGEETQIAGLAAMEPGFDGVVVAPGTHSKWARLSGGRLERFSTYMSGEMFGLLAEQSMLRHSLGRAPGEDGGEADEAAIEAAFEAAIAETVARPAAFTQRLFALRAAHLLRDAGGPELRARLSGLVIGLEIADALIDAPDGAEIAVIADGPIADRYLRAFALVDRPARRIGAEETTLAGLSAAYAARAAEGDWT